MLLPTQPNDVLGDAVLSLSLSLWREQAPPTSLDIASECLLPALAAKAIERKRVSKQALCSSSDSIVLGAALDRERSRLADRHSSLLPVSHRMERLAQHSMRRRNVGSLQPHRQIEESTRERRVPALVDLVESFLDHEDRERVRQRRDRKSTRLNSSHT